MSRFKGLSDNLSTRSAPSAAPLQAPAREPAARAKAREGKRAVVGYFSSELSRELRLLSVQEGTTVQALVGEAIDLLLRARGKHPYGER